MTNEKKSRGTGSRGRFYHEAQSLYVIGKSLEEILQRFPSLQLWRLQKWCNEGQWMEKRRQALVSTRWMAQALKALLQEKVRSLLAKGELNPPAVEELTKLAALIDRVGDQRWDFRAAALEVMDRFADFLHRRVEDTREIERFSKWLQQFFRHLENDGRGGV